MSSSEILPEESFFDFKCPYCGELNSFPKPSAGTLQECASCGESIIVPEAGAATAGKLPEPISTPRLLLRRFRPDDAAKLLEMVERDETCTLAVNEANVEQWIEQQRAARFTRSQYGVCLAIELVEGGELAGYVLLNYADGEHHSARFTVEITPSRRRQGLGLEAARAAMGFAFDGLRAQRIAVSCPSQDAAARRLLEKAGLRQEGEFVKSWFDGSAWVNVSWYAMLKEERP
jgi:RimJ/RimL family protein N-acetyltransferase